MTIGSTITLTTLEQAQRQALHDALESVSQQADPLFRELAAVHTDGLVAEARRLAAGEVWFDNTESWRAAYEKLLLELDFSTYFSAAWVRTSSYWRDSAGKRSLRLNYDLLDRGLRIERILILPEPLWETHEPAPAATIRTWIEEQHYRGIKLSLVRQSDLSGESALIRDFGIYGERATGEQQLDEECRTTCFRLAFAPAAVHAAQQQWQRLQVFSRPCKEVIDLA